MCTPPALDWMQFTFGEPANRRYKILFPQTQNEIVQLESTLQIPAAWSDTIAGLTKTYPLGLKPFYELRLTGNTYNDVPLILAITGAIAPMGATHEVRAAYGHWVVAAVPAGAENELRADLIGAHHDCTSNLAAIAFTGFHLVGAGTDCILKNVRVLTNQATKPLAQLQPAAPWEKSWRLSPSEQAFVDRAFGSLEQAFADDLQALERARKWRMGTTDITKHPRAKPLEAFVPGNLSLRRLEKALNEHHYPHIEERRLTPAAFRHLKWLLQERTRKLARLRQRRKRAKSLPAVLPTAKKV
jgi:hypothetical protein